MRLIQRNRYIYRFSIYCKCTFTSRYSSEIRTATVLVSKFYSSSTDKKSANECREDRESLSRSSVKQTTVPKAYEQKNYSSYCVELVRKHEYESFLCSLLLKGEDFRSFVFAVRAFNVEIALIRDQVSQQDIGIGRLAFWRDAVNKIFQNKTSKINVTSNSDLPRHPVVLELNRVIRNITVSKKWFTNLTDARERTLNDVAFRDLQDLEAYCDKCVSPILYLGLEALDIKNVDVDHACGHLGKAIGLTNFIRSIPYNAQRRRVAFPQELLLKHKLSQENFIRFSNKDKIADAVYDIASQAHVHYKKASTLKSCIPKEGLPLTLIGTPTDIYLKRLQYYQFNPYDLNLNNRYSLLPVHLYYRKFTVLKLVRVRMVEGTSKTSTMYQKLLPGCRLSEEPVDQPEFDLSLQYLKKCFPTSTMIQKDTEQILKRTFVLESSEKKRKYLAKKKPTRMEGSTRKIRTKKEWTVPRFLNYQLFVQLNAMWKSYVADLLQDEERPEEIQQKLNRIDLHGSFLTVVDANCKDYLGLNGIVVKESKNVFTIVTSKGTTKRIPKAENVFNASLDKPEGSLKICGNSFLTRPAERASKKMKSFMEFIGSRAYKSRLRYTWPK